MEFKGNETGKCPFCGEQNLDYGVVVFQFDTCYFPWKCLSCEHEGEEWYSMEFIGHNVETEDGFIEVENIENNEDIQDKLYKEVGEN